MKPIEKEFSQGVKILLERMENNPEDFVSGDRYPKFGMFADLMRDVVRGNRVKDWDDWYLFTKAEQSALVEGYKKMMRSRFDQGIMQRLLDEPESRPELGVDWSTDATDAYRLAIDRAMIGTPEIPTKLMLNPTQMKLAQKLSMSPIDYAIKITNPPQK